MEFEIGKPLPIPSLVAPGQEECRVNFNEAFMDIVYWIPASERDLVITFMESELEYGLFVAHDVPFFLISFPSSKWNFDVSLNIKKVLNDKVDNWLNSEFNAVTLYLCDCHTNELLGIRFIGGLQTTTANAIRDTLKKQNNRYKDSKEVDDAIDRTMQLLTTGDMLQQTKLDKNYNHNYLSASKHDYYHILLTVWEVVCVGGSLIYIP